MRQTISKQEILRGYGSYRNVLAHGKVYKGKKLRIFALLEPSEEFKEHRLRIGFGVSKERSAVARNRMKRLMHEVVRRNKEFFYHCCKHASVSHLILMCSSPSHSPTGRPGPSYQELDEEFHTLMKQLSQRY